MNNLPSGSLLELGLLAAMAAALTTLASAQEVRLLAPINPRTGPDPDANPRRFVSFGGWVYSASDAGLVRYDAAGRDPRQIYPGVTDVVVAGARLFLLGGGVAVSDGTAAGTTSVLTAPTGYPPPDQITAVGSSAAFVFSSWQEGRELWFTDGTTANTRLVADIRPGSAGSSPRSLTTLGDLFFLADDGARGEELWRSDGTAAGTVLVADIRPGTPGCDLRHLAAGISRLWFFADDGGGHHLWRSDGTAAGTIKVAPAVPDATLTPFGNGVMYLQTRGGRTEVWLSDGTGAGTRRVRDVGPASNRATDIRPHVAGGYWYFAVPDTAGNGELWRSDGTASGTVALTPSGHLPAGSELQSLGTRVFFAAGLGSSQGVEPWWTDGTASSARQVFDIHPTGSSMPRHLTALHGRIWMAADDGRHGVEPWVTNGTSAGTAFVGNVATYGDPSEVPWMTRVAGDEAWFIQELGAGTRLVRTDGTLAGTSTVAIPAIGLSPGRQVMVGAGRAFFVAPTGPFGGITDLWMTDGTAPGTIRLFPGIGWAQDMADLGTVAVFGAGVTGHELWRTDGTFAGTFRLGTHRVSDVRLAIGYRFLRVGRQVWFADGLQRLAVTDGSLAGTRVVAATAAYPMTSQPIRFGDRIAFLSGSRELVMTDGTTAGTSTVAMPATSWLGAPVAMEATSQGIFVLLMNIPYGAELWYSDGSTARQLLYDGRPFSTGGHVFQDRFYFRWFSNSAGSEPWVSDGTSQGTRLLVDIEPGRESSGGGNLTVTGSRYFYFRATRDHESRIWRSDGTAAGTQPVTSGPQAVSHALGHIGGRLLFFGQDPDLGYQPFVVDLFASSRGVGYGCASGNRVPRLAATDPVLGGRLRLTLESPHTNQGALALFGVPTRMETYLRLPGGCTVLPDPGLPTLGVALRTDAAGTARLDLPLPNLPGLIRARLYAQAAVGVTANPPLGTDLSPGVSLTLGR